MPATAMYMYTVLLTLTVGFLQLQVVNGESCSVMMTVDAGQDGRLLRQKTMSAFRATCRKDKTEQTPFTIQKLECEHQNFAINCADGETIDVKWALYGFDADSSHRCFINDVGPCDGRDETRSLEKVKSECQGIRQCTIIPNNVWYGPDPCPNVGKYLNVTYVCLHGST